MLLGLPIGLFYYDYIYFFRELLRNTAVEIITCGIAPGTNEKKQENVVSEICVPIKNVSEQLGELVKRCDKVFIPRVMKDCAGRWMCPKQLGLPELIGCDKISNKCIISDPLYFNRKNETKKAFWKICRRLEIGYKLYSANFDKAYDEQIKIESGYSTLHIDDDWKYRPVLKPGEILLPNERKALLLGHSYNIYNNNINMNIIKKLDDLGIDVITEDNITRLEQVNAVNQVELISYPFWNSFVRMLGSALCIKDSVDGIIYVSSFSCGPDSFIYEMIKKNVMDKPIMLIKIDEHQGEEGLRTRLEAFRDLLLERRMV